MMTTEERIAVFRKIVDDRSASFVKKTDDGYEAEPWHEPAPDDVALMDIQTANVIVTVFDAVKPETQEKMMTLEISQLVNVCCQLVNVCWKCVK